MMGRPLDGLEGGSVLGMLNGITFVINAQGQTVARLAHGARKYVVLNR